MNLQTSVQGHAMPRHMGTVDSFLMDGTIHLRYSRFGEDRLFHVKSLSFSSGILMIRWTDQAKEQGLPPVAGQEIDIYSIRQGVLYLSKGSVLELTSGSLPRIRIKVKSEASRVALRKHQRYIVRGIIHLGPAGMNFTYRQQADHEMDISEGGIGLRLPPGAMDPPKRRPQPGAVKEKPDSQANVPAHEERGDLAPSQAKVESVPGEQAVVNATPAAPAPMSSTIASGTGEAAKVMRLEMTIHAEQSGRVDQDQPALNLSCHAEVRRRTPVEGTPDEFVGMQFMDLSSDQRETLRLWLATNSVRLRCC